jgi:vacuolar-type H+-ATPase catalytic subunit A/Vma1
VRHIVDVCLVERPDERPTAADVVVLLEAVGSGALCGCAPASGPRGEPTAAAAAAANHVFAALADAMRRRKASPVTIN